jgi:hypothetical protein
VSTLYNRANPPQHRMLRVIEGAVMNAAHAHREFKVTRTFAKSVAKRATGTLTAQWPEVLAATTPSGKAVREYCKDTRRRRKAQPAKPNGRGAVAAPTSRALLRKLHARVSKMISEPKRAGNTERMNGLIDVCRLLSRLIEEMEGG